MKNSEGEYHCFYCVNQDHWAGGFPNIEDEQRGWLHINAGTVKENVEKEDNTTGVTFFKNHQKTNNRKHSDTNKIYFDSFSAYNQVMDEKYATRIHQAKSAIYEECNAGVSEIN